ncbi:MAG: hypothetical protein AAF961_16180 [Planctomycetota bacterium]
MRREAVRTLRSYVAEPLARRALQQALEAARKTAAERHAELLQFVLYPGDRSKGPTAAERPVTVDDWIAAASRGGDVLSGARLFASACICQSSGKLRDVPYGQRRWCSIRL